MANTPPMPNQVHRQWVNPFWRDMFRKYLMRLVGIYFRIDQAQSLTDAVDVSIDRHLWWLSLIFRAKLYHRANSMVLNSLTSPILKELLL